MVWETCMFSGAGFVLLGFIFLTLFNKQLLLSLISLEFVSLGLFMVLFTGICRMDQPLSVALYFMVMAVCEASLGLSLLVQLTRFKGKDLLMSNHV